MTDIQQTTMITAAGTDQSPDRWGCPGVHQVTGHEEDRFVITKDDVTDEVRELLAGHVAEGEHVGRAPAWVPCGLMDLGTLGLFMEDHLHRRGDNVFRMERLPAYAVQEPLYDLWRAGGDLDMDLKGDWLEYLREHQAAGIRHSRVRVLPHDLTDYQRYSCAWGYALNEEAGEDIRVLREGEHDIPAGLIKAEYWLVNDEIAVPTHYDGDGAFIGAGWLGPEESARFLSDRDAAWAAAEPFGQWWASHEELHRSTRLVA